MRSREISPRVHAHQLVDDGVDMPVRQVRCARQYGLEALPDERAQVAPQQRGKSGLLVHLRAFLPEPAPGFEAGSSAERRLQRSLRRPPIGHIRSEDGLVIGRQLLGLSGLVVVEAQRKLKQAL